MLLCGRPARSLVKRIVAAALALALPAAGCGYNSEYTPPLDGRARAVWRSNNVVLEPAGAPMPPSCTQEVMNLSATGRLRVPPEYARPAGGYWTPRYYGPSIVVVAPGIVPVFPPPLFLPTAFVAAPHPVAPAAPVLGLGGLGGGGGDSGKALAVLAVIALIVLPAVDIGLAAARPESPERSSQAIDQVNAFNDLSRTPGSPCSYEALAGGAQ